MDARNFFLVAPVPKQVLKQNQFGATIGGPVIKDRTFFFSATRAFVRWSRLPGFECSYPGGRER